MRARQLAAALGALSALALALGATQAQASQPPTVEMTVATSVTQTSATLNATVNPNGPAVSKCEFKYGTTICYGSSQSCSPLAGSGNDPRRRVGRRHGPCRAHHLPLQDLATTSAEPARAQIKYSQRRPLLPLEPHPLRKPRNQVSHTQRRGTRPAGDLFVADPGESRVVEFNAERKYLRQFGEAGSGPGQFQGIGGIATNASGDLYVTDPGNARVQEFGPLRGIPALAARSPGHPRRRRGRRRRQRLGPERLQLPRAAASLSSPPPGPS